MAHPNITKFSQEGGCAPESMCFPLRGTKDQKRQWLRSRKLYLAKCGGYLRTFALICVRFAGRLRAYFMDAITGTLYSPRSMRAPASDYLRIEQVCRAQDRAASMLLGWV